MTIESRQLELPPRVLLGPGLAKAKPVELDDLGSGTGHAVVAARHATLWSIRDTWIARILEEADIFSEGECVSEPRGAELRAVYYGSTSMRCALHAVRSRIEGEALSELLSPTEIAQALLAHPYVRLCAVRIARREACVRSGAALNVMQAELSARVLREGDDVRLAVDVDVSAELARLHEHLTDE